MGRLIKNLTAVKFDMCHFKCEKRIMNVFQETERIF